MVATPASAERVQKFVFNFEIYRSPKKRPIYPILPYLYWFRRYRKKTRRVGGSKYPPSGARV